MSRFSTLRVLDQNINSNDSFLPITEKLSLLVLDSKLSVALLMNTSIIMLRLQDQLTFTVMHVARNEKMEHWIDEYWGITSGSGEFADLPWVMGLNYMDVWERARQQEREAVHTSALSHAFAFMQWVNGVFPKQLASAPQTYRIQSEKRITEAAAHSNRFIDSPRSFVHKSFSKLSLKHLETIEIVQT